MIPRTLDKSHLQSLHVQMTNKGEQKGARYHLNQIFKFQDVPLTNQPSATIGPIIVDAIDLSQRRMSTNNNQERNLQKELQL